MSQLGRGEPQRPANGVEDLAGNVDVAALFEPGVPGHPDPGQDGDLLAAQSRSPALTRGRYADVAGREAGPAGTQEVPELFTRNGHMSG
jgi:hypothetical protein